MPTDEVERLLKELEFRQLLVHCLARHPAAFDKCGLFTCITARQIGAKK